LQKGDKKAFLERFILCACKKASSRNPCFQVPTLKGWHVPVEDEVISQLPNEPDLALFLLLVQEPINGGTPGVIP
jgi:hypothetical protein